MTRKPNAYDLPTAAKMLRMSSEKLVRLIKLQLFDATLQPETHHTRISRDALVDFCLWRGIGLGPLDYGWGR